MLTDTALPDLALSNKYPSERVSEPMPWDMASVRHHVLPSFRYMPRQPNKAISNTKESFWQCKKLYEICE
jgi:hypothetical protein